MDYVKLSAISSALLTLITTIGVLFAIIYYLFIMIKINLLQIILFTTIYIDIILIFLYLIKKNA
jgi:hypothetical protein